MASIETPQERQVVVAAVRGDRVAASQQLTDLAMVCYSGLDLASYFGIGWVRFHDPQQASVSINSSVSAPGPYQLELLLRLRVKAGDTFREHLCQVIASLDLSALHQAQQQRVSLGRRDVLHLSGVQHLGLTSKVADLRWSQPREQRTLVTEELQPAQVCDEFVEVRQRRPRGWLFETVEHAPSRWLGLEQSVQEPAFLLGDAPDDQLEEARMDERPDSTNETVQRA